MKQRTLSEKLFAFCSDGHKDTTGRQALPYPEWLLSIHNDQQAARRAFAALQAAWMTEAFWTLENWMAKAEPGSDGTPDLDHWLAIQRLQGLSFTPGKVDPLADALQTLIERGRYGETANVPAPIGWSRNRTLHKLATEASSRDPSTVTPPDIAQFMASLAIDPAHCAVYMLDGIGLLHGTTSQPTPELVADELGRAQVKPLPPELQDIYGSSGVWYRNRGFVNRAFAELQWHHENDHAPLPASTLLVNASNHLTPFFDSKDAASPGREAERGPLNHLLEGGYQRVVVLVPNSALTSGRQTHSRSVHAEDILRFCASRGLSRVIQLPMGTTGNRHLGHTVLVFDTLGPSRQIEFAEIPESATRPAPKGFGYARRALQLRINEATPDGLPIEAARKTVGLEDTIQKGRKRISFEANLFLDLDPLEGFRRHSQFVSLGSLVDIFRVQHLPPASDLHACECAEIGASDIDEWGHVGPGRIRSTAADIVGFRHDETLRQDDLLLCFRGSSESFGKVAWIRETPGVMTLPNQSFLVLRPKRKPVHDAPVPGLIFWWLRSPWVRRYLEQRAVSTGVSRISPRDVAAIEIPCAPGGLLEKETQRLMAHESLLKQFKEIENEMQRIQADAWTSEEDGDDGTDR